MPLMLTAKEKKKIRKQRREEREKERQVCTTWKMTMCVPQRAQSLSTEQLLELRLHLWRVFSVVLLYDRIMTTAVNILLSISAARG